LFTTLLMLPLVFANPVDSPKVLASLGGTVRMAPKKTDVLLPTVRHLDVTLTEVDAAQVANLLKDSLPAPVRDRLKGRIGKVAVQIRGDTVEVKAEKFRLAGEWLTKAEGTADLKTRKYKLKLWAFGGLMEAEGTLPAD
jgi:hypothetical protein